MYNKFSGGTMYFIGIITDKNSENNIKNRLKNKIKSCEIFFLNSNNMENYKNVKFDSIVVNTEVMNTEILDRIINNSKHILYNIDINKNNYINSSICKNLITYGYSSNAGVTISSATDENYLIYVQTDIVGYNKSVGMQEVRFDRFNENINAYDGIITTAIDIMYND